MENVHWTFVIYVRGWSPPGCLSAAPDRSERLPVRHIIPAFHQAQPIHISCLPAWVFVCLRVSVKHEGGKKVQTEQIFHSMCKERPQLEVAAER